MSFKYALAVAAVLGLAGGAQAATCGNTSKGFGGFIQEMKREADAAGVSAQAS
jgi:hypothetical protein